MLTLPIKNKWLSMIVSGQKTEEYREVKTYWTTRFQSIGLLDENEYPTFKTTNIELKGGYGKDAPSAVVRVTMKKRTGKPEWGANPGETYYVLQIRDIISSRGTSVVRVKREKLFGG